MTTPRSQKRRAAEPAAATLSPEALPAAWVRETRTRLLRWYGRHKRDLPWRQSRDPYAIWISETMLQQTRVETVIPYWHRFLEHFPDVASLADASQEDVYSAWTGLGYYSRARNLQTAARQIMDEHDGALPKTVDELRRLQGIGPYTAGAVASIAFDRPAAIVDGNVVRVLSRLRGLREDVGQKAIMDRLWSWSESLVSAGRRAGDFNQAMMELGATVCLPRAPLCLSCPLRNHCDAERSGDAESLPIKASRKKPKVVSAVAVWIERRGKVLVVQRPETGLMANLWELPGGEIDVKKPQEADTRAAVRAATGLAIGQLERAGQVTHLFTHRKLTLHVHVARRIEGRVHLGDLQAFRWLAPHALADLPQAGPMRKALALLGRGPEESPRARMRTGQAQMQAKK
ncbi:MAG: A/G-specific adenine glycosylase [Deltaproteobacteria bacterium]|nr:MAG: A/G-specific adenine glycosylase [Deltaproteobacteria bacterium]